MPHVKITELDVAPGDTIEMQDGDTYALCTCGYSAKLPFCDGAHKEKAPTFKSIKVEIKRGGTCKIYE